MPLCLVSLICRLYSEVHLEANQVTLSLFITLILLHNLYNTMSAVAGPSTASYLGRAADYVRPDFHQVNLDIEGYLKTERNLKLDEGESLPSEIK